MDEWVDGSGMFEYGLLTGWFSGRLGDLSLRQSIDRLVGLLAN